MVYVFLAEGFEEIEALTPIDMLRRAGIEVSAVGISGEMIKGSHGITVRADLRPEDVIAESAEACVLPGGMPGTLNLMNSPMLSEILDRCERAGTRIAAICAAPMILGRRGMLRGKKAVCYPGFEKELDGASVTRDRVVTDGKITTAAGMGVALDFACELIRLLRGADAADAALASVMAGRK